MLVPYKCDYKSEQLLNDNDEGNGNEQQHISKLISNAKAVNKSHQPAPMSMDMVHMCPPKLLFEVI